MTVSAPPNRPRTGDSDLARDVDRRRRVVPPGPGQRAVHADHAGQPEPERPGQERHPAAHAEAEREHRSGRGPAVLGRPDLLDRGRDVGPDAGPGRLGRMGACSRSRRRAARVPPSARTSRAPARRSRARRTAGPAPRSTDGARERRAGSRRRPPTARWRAPGTPRTGSVGRGQHQRHRVERATGDRRDRRAAVMVEAHGAASGRWERVGGRHRTALPGRTGLAR